MTKAEYICSCVISVTSNMLTKLLITFIPEGAVVSVHAQCQVVKQQHFYGQSTYEKDNGFISEISVIFPS